MENLFRKGWKIFPGGSYPEVNYYSLVAPLTVNIQEMRDAIMEVKEIEEYTIENNESDMRANENTRFLEGNKILEKVLKKSGSFCQLKVLNRFRCELP